MTCPTIFFGDSVSIQAIQAAPKTDVCFRCFGHCVISLQLPTQWRRALPATPQALWTGRPPSMAFAPSVIPATCLLCPSLFSSHLRHFNCFESSMEAHLPRPLHIGAEFLVRPPRETHVRDLSAMFDEWRSGSFISKMDSSASSFLGHRQVFFASVALRV